MRFLWVTVAVLVSIHVTMTVVHYQIHELPWLLRQIFDVDEEDSFPTWYSSMALGLTAVVLAWHAWGNRARAQQEGLIAWRGLAVGFLLLSVDEIAGVHETLNTVTDFSWAVPGAGLCLVLGLIYLRFLWGLPRRTAVAFIIAGAVFVGGAVGVELLTEPFEENDALDTLPYNIWTAVEESMEMGGVLLFLNALLKHMAAGHEQTTLKIELRNRS